MSSRDQGAGHSDVTLLQQISLPGMCQFNIDEECLEPSQIPVQEKRKLVALSSMAGLVRSVHLITYNTKYEIRNTKYEIVYFKNMIKNKWQKNDNNQNKVNMFMLIRRLQNSNN